MAKAASQHPFSDTTLTPHNRIKEKLDSSLSLRDVFDSKILQEAEKVIKSSRQDFLAKAKGDVRLLRECAASLKAGEHASPHLLHVMTDAAFELKNLAGTFGYVLATAVAISLQRYLEAMEEVRQDDKEILKAHVDSLAAIFTQNIEGGGGNVGRELLRSLDALVKKYRR